jgi:hypothetical protein
LDVTLMMLSLIIVNYHIVEIKIICFHRTLTLFII